MSNGINNIVKKRILFIFIGFTILVVIFYFTSVHFAKGFLHPNQTIIKNYPEKFTVENVSFITEDGLKINGWRSNVSDSSKAIILLHGYKANREEMISRAEIFIDLGYNVLMYDARGCGESEGNIVSLGYYETMDLKAAMKFMQELNYKEIGVYGFSQGGATAILATDEIEDLKFIIAEATFDNLENAIDNRFKKYFFISGSLGTIFMKPEAEKLLGISIDEISPVKEINKIHIPIFIIGGEKDSRTTEENTINLFNSANEPKELWIVTDSEHENIYNRNPDLYKLKIKSFLNKLY